MDQENKWEIDGLDTARLRTTGQMRKFNPASLGQWQKLPQSDSHESPPPRMCEYCGGEKGWLKVDLWDSGVRWAPRPCGCEAETEANRQLERQRREQERQGIVSGLMSGAGLIEGQWSKMTLDAWDSTRFPDAARAYDTVLAYLKGAQDNSRNWLYLYGPYGIGKTHLAVSAIRALVELRLWPAYATVWPEHCAHVQETWDAAYSGVTEGQLWSRMRDVKLLLIDDIDKRHPSPWAMGKLYEVIERRYRLEKPTIITANRSVNDLAAFWSSIDMGKANEWKTVQIADAGSATMSRIVGQLWGAVEMRGKDQRW